MNNNFLIKSNTPSMTVYVTYIHR